MKQLISMLAGAADGAMLVQDGTIVFWNKAAERLLGYHADEVVGRPCHDVLRGETLSGHPLCSPSCPIGRRIASGGSVRNFDLRTHTKAGRTIWLNVSSLPAPGRKPGRFLAVHLFRNITGQARIRRLIEALHSAACCAEPGDFEAQAEQAPEVPAVLPVSDREREILRLLASGKSTKTIADSLCISPATVRNHIQHILEKLGAHSRLQALVIAFHSGPSSS